VGQNAKGGFMVLSKKWNTFRCVYVNERIIVIMSIILAIIFAAISAGTMTPLWNTITTFIVSLAILLSALVMCMPTNGMSNSLFIPTFLSFLGCCILFTTVVSAASGYLHV